MAIVSLGLSVALGCLLVFRFGGFRSIAPRWAAWMLAIGAGIAIGLGFSGCLFLLLQWAPARAHGILQLAIVAWLGYDCRRRTGSNPQEPAPPRKYAFVPLLAGAFVIALILATYAMSTAWAANPQGNWDAWSIWNLRAKFLASPGNAARAWSPVLTFTHPEYPLLWSGLVAACWSDAGVISDAAPIAASYLFFLALLCMITGGIGVLRGPVPGLLAGLCLMGIPALLTEVPSQYADVPLACFMAGAVLMALLDCPVMSGTMAGFAAFTKDEGLLFLAVVFVAIAVFSRSQMVRFCLGAAPAAAMALIFKLVIARATSLLLSGASLSKIMDGSRIQTVVSQMFQEIFRWNAGWYHPVLPIVILAVAWRVDGRQRRDALFVASIAALVLLGYFAVYLVTPNDLTWQLQTSLTRLYVQISPIVLITAFIAMGGPEAAAPDVVENMAVEPKKRGRKGKSR
jgi:hypothetical protein